MNKSSDIKKEIQELKKLVKKHDQLYYMSADPEISDYQYDTLVKRLAELEAKYPELADDSSPTRSVGSDLSAAGKEIPHRLRMYSISNAYSLDEVKSFLTKAAQKLGLFVDKQNSRDEVQVIEELSDSDTEDAELPVSLELKIDGFSINLFYEGGILQYATTRGDGFKGEDVTGNVKILPSIPKKIDYLKAVEIRGEIYMPIAEFERINRERAERGEKLFANPRNAAAGTIKIKDSTIVAERRLESIMYGVGYFEEENIKNQHHLLSWLENNSFNVGKQNALASSFSNIAEYCRIWEKKRSDLDFEIDGVVIKIDDFTFREDLGYTDKSPKWAIAYKFKAEEKTTKIDDVIFSVGRTGAVTPIALLQPVYIAGSTVSRATLHNEEELKRLDIHIGDTVTVVKSGDIIPKVLRVETEERKKDAKRVIYPEMCPVCHTLLTKEPEGVICYCNNINCPAQIQKRIEHFASKKAMDIDGLGEALIAAMLENNIISSFEDIYKIDFEKVKQLDKQGDKSAANLQAAIEQSKKQPFNRVLYALGIRHIGDKTAKIIAKHFPGINILKNTTVQEFTEIDEIGEKIGQSLYDFFHNELSLNTINQLQQAGLSFEAHPSTAADTSEKGENRLNGKSFLVTGTLSLYKRDEIHDLIESSGGRVISAVSKKLDYLIVGDNPGSKLEKAGQIGTVKILTEQDFLSMMEKPD